MPPKPEPLTYISETSYSINDWTCIIHEWAKNRGWWENPDRNFSELMALIHTEVSEAFEEYRDGHEPTEVYYAQDKYDNWKPEGVPTELADIAIRLLDLCGFYGIDLESEIDRKMKYNMTRPYRHGGKRA